VSRLSGLRALGAPRRALSATPCFSKLTEADITHFRTILNDNDVITDPSALEQFNSDWMKKYKGKSKLALRPRTTEQVSQILKHCNERKLPVVPQGGNTGLVGGSVAVDDEVVLSLTGMDKILAFDEFAGTVTCQAGAVLQTVQEKAEEHGYTFPLDLGAKGSCQIGGNVATNAGGLRFLRYGSLHGTVLGIEAVLADGTVINNLNTLKKDNTGYDIKQLFIGSEGTLGIITGIAIALPPLPKSVKLAYLALDSYESVLKVFREAKSHLAEVLSAVEFLDDQALELTLEHLHGARNPLESRSPFYMLIEVSGSNEEHDGAKLEGFLEHVMEAGMVTDGTLAADTTQMAGARAALPPLSPGTL
jgi:FAD/FMN-containing dehydrogenase